MTLFFASVILSILSRSVSESFTEQAVKVIDILKTGFVGGFSYCNGLVGQQKASLLQACLNQFIHGGTVKVSIVIFIKLAFPEVKDFAELVDAPGMLAAVQHLFPDRQQFVEKIRIRFIRLFLLQLFTGDLDEKLMNI